MYKLFDCWSTTRPTARQPDSPAQHLDCDVNEPVSEEQCLVAIMIAHPFLVLDNWHLLPKAQTT